MTLYHGTNVDIKTIDLAMCRPYKDFGRGFYLTELKEQAEKMATRVARIFGGNPVVICYEIADDFLANTALNIKNFGRETSEEWARFVMNNRKRNNYDYSNPECNLDNKYDVVIGPIANDDMAVLFRQFENGIISFDNLLNGMIYKETTNQYSFHTEKSIALLKKIEVRV